MDRARLADFCRRRGIRRRALFGSVLGEAFGLDSDIDVLVEFEPGQTPGLEFFEAEAELSELAGRKIDLSTPAFLSRYFRDDVLRSAVVQYAGPEGCCSHRHMARRLCNVIG